jgi:uncharacterized protein (TIGR03435 family)
MHGIQAWAVLALAVPVLASPQAQDTPPAFDVASVKQHSEDNPPGTMMQELPGSLQYRKVNLIAVIQRAYGVEALQVVAPAWMSSEAYDINAKLPGDTPVPRLQLMLQKLLAERFQLKIHHDKKEMAAYNMVVAKDGFKMHPSEGGRLGYRPFNDSSGRHLRGKITLTILANNLSGIFGHPVLDQTGVDGLYDIDLNYSDDAASPEKAKYPGIAVALQEQLGLKLEPKKTMFEMIIVDHAEKVPTAN